MKKKHLYAPIFILSFFCIHCSSTVLPDKEHYIDLFCPLGISYYDSLLTDIDYVMFRSSNFLGDRNSFVIDFSDKGRIIVIKDECNFFYKEVLFTDNSTMGTLSSPYCLKNIDWQYPVRPEKVIRIINFCLDNYIYEISVCREDKEKRYYFKTHIGTIYYTTNSFYSENAENLCDNWFL